MGIRTNEPLLGRISIGYPRGGDSEYVLIEITDEASRTTIVDVHVSYEQFAKALSSLGDRPCVYELNSVDRAGVFHEHKSERIPLSVNRYDADRERVKAALRAACKPYEVDGWVAQIEAALNTKQSGDVMNVIFRRYEQPAPPAASDGFLRDETEYLEPAPATPEGA